MEMFILNPTFIWNNKSSTKKKVADKNISNGSMYLG